MAKKTIFITGTDTDVGKTRVAAALLERARQAGLRTLAMKPVAAGCEQTAEGLRNDDALALQQSMTEILSYEQLNPIALEAPLAPHIAADRSGRQLSAQRLVGLCLGLQMNPADLLVIEGAGGWRVPLNNRETLAQIPKALKCDVVMVVALRLGCINHALLTAEAIQADGLRLAGWVANRTRKDAMGAEAENLHYLQQHLAQHYGSPLLGDLPWLAHPEPLALAQHLAIQPLIDF
jgi:dethiobiotin synthetase